MQSEKTAQIIKKAYEKAVNDREGARPDIESLKKEFGKVNERLNRLSRAYSLATLNGINDDTLGEMIEQIALTQDRKENLEIRINFLESQDSALKDELSSMPDEEIIHRAFWQWLLYTRAIIMPKPVEKPAKYHETARQIIRAFVTRIDIKGQDVIPVMRFDEELLESPLEELVHAVVRVRELGRNLPDPNTVKQDTSFL